MTGSTGGQMPPSGGRGMVVEDEARVQMVGRELVDSVGPRPTE
jgi:hypothetical protein